MKIETMNDAKYVKALKLMLDEFEYPSRDLRLAAQVFDCKTEVYAVCEWLRRECQREIDIRELFAEGSAQSE